MHNKTLNALRTQRLDVKQAENAALTYVVNWAAVLDGATVASSSWSTEDGSLTIANEANTTLQASARLSGDIGTYRAINQIVDSDGDTHERVIQLTVARNEDNYPQDYGLSTYTRF